MAALEWCKMDVDAKYYQIHGWIIGKIESLYH
jgi:hypothetical protein